MGVFTVLASLQRGAAISGAPDSLRTGLADPPEGWPAANPEARFSLVTIIYTFLSRHQVVASEAEGAVCFNDILKVKGKGKGRLLI